MSADESLQDLAIDRFWETIPPLWGVIRSHLRATATENLNLTVEEFHVLRHVRRGSGSISELAAAKKISRPAISQAVDVLVNKGLLTRLQNGQDRRYVKLALSESGNSMLDAVLEENRRWMKERMQTLTADELATISKAMQAMKKMLV